MWIFGRPNVKKLQAKGDIHGLIKALGRDDFDIPPEAVEALAAIGTPAIEPLLTTIEDLKGRDRGFFSAPSQAIWCQLALEEIGDARAIELAQAMFEKWDEEARERRRVALGQRVKKLRAKGDIQSLINLVRYFGDWSGLDAIDALVEIGAPAIEPLVAALKDASEKRASWIAIILESTGDPRAMALVNDAVEKWDTDQRAKHELNRKLWEEHRAAHK